MSLARLIGGYVVRHWPAYTGSAAMLCAIALLGVWLPRQVGLMVDGLVGNRLSGMAMWAEVGWLLAAGAAIYGLRVAWRLLLFGTAFRLGVQLRMQLYQRLALHSPQFFQTRRTGDLMALATNDVDAVEMAAGEALLAGFDGTITLVLVVAAMALGVDWRLALVVLLPFPLMALAFWWISSHLHQAARDALDAFGRLNDQVQESLTGVRTLRALWLEALSSQQFGQLAGEASRTALVAQRWEAAYEPAVGLSLATAMTLSLGYGGWLVWHDQLSVGQLTSFGLYLGQLIWPMFAAGWVLSLAERGRAAWARLAPVLDAAPHVPDQGSVADMRSATLVAQGLHFQYPGQTQPALADVSLRLDAGKTLGVVGPTGAGKSTLLKLLLRQWQPQQGELRWGELPWADLSLAALRAGIAWVPQEAFLFSATVADNIALARPESSREQVVAAARLAAVHDELMQLPQGYDTQVGERGITLSGGQRQRVAIARALLADAPLLLLDDALSAVDTATEAQILGALRALRQQRQGRSMVVVSHRLSTLQDADQIVVLRHGQVGEQGSHAELLALDGWYAHQWQVQQLQASLEGPDTTTRAAVGPIGAAL